jgi:glycyl-radical enzyme activating protein/glucokinase-like ROK family protein
MNDWVIGVDLGGTKIEIGLVAPDNYIAGRIRIPTDPGAGPRRVVERIVEKVNELAALLPPGNSIAALGLCSPGPVDNEAGTLLDPPNLGGLHYAPLQQMLSDRLGIPVQIDHDAKATGLGEYYYGAGRGECSMAYVIVGTGVGSAIILNGQLLRGQNNIAGEIGHVPLDRDGDICSCGSRGCVETFLAGPWLARRYLRKVKTAGSGRIADPPDQAPQSTLTAVDIVNLALDGDALAGQVMEEAGGALGAAIATLAMVLDLDLFVVGGSVVKSGDLLLEPARRAVPLHCYRSVGCGIRIVATELGEDGPLLGCAWMARDALARAHSQVGAAVPQSAADFRMAAKTLSERDRLERVEGMVFNVQRFSLHDGPGLRTDVFFKGCPLRCAWCANPESQRFQPELALSARECIRCGQFEDFCADIWDHGAVTQSERDKFGQRAEVCPGGALRWLGERRTAGNVMAEVLRDLPFYSSGGGMTLTGGEPTSQPEFAEALLRLAKEEGLSTAMETSGHTRWKVFERLLPHLDLVLFDLKHMDSAAHRRGTGVDNDLILANLRRLAEIRAPVTVRVPLIPGFNADPDSLGAIAHFVVEQEGLEKHVSLLPYHILGKSKYASLGRPYPWEDHPRLSQEEVQNLAQVMESYGLEVSTGS